jgi:glycosyltransferase involved in cell wall biosynthesis
VANSDLWTFHVTRNRLFVLWKNARLSLAAKVTAAFVYLFVIKPCLLMVVGRRTEEQRHRLRMGSRITLSFLQHVPLILRKRAGLAAEAGIDSQHADIRAAPSSRSAKRTTIGIYDVYLNTRGGGEKLCLSIAAILAANRSNEVVLITKGDADLAELGEYFDIDLGRVKLYSLAPDGRLMRMLHRRTSGVALKELVTDWALFRSLRRMRLDVFVNATYRSMLPSPAPRGYYLCMFPHKRTNPAAGRGPLINAYRRVVGVLYRSAFGIDERRAMESYETIVSISEFTKRYVQRYWDIDSEVLYPICDDLSDSDPPPKEHVILNVARFFAPNNTSHNKNHRLMIEQFAQMHTLINEGWELHLAGSLMDDKESLEYVIDLLRLAQGLPVHFHIDATFSELKHLYNVASIYWHATGFGADPDEAPEAQEHFGITTGEAMLAGVIPVVINTAGQQELVEHGVSGYLWASLSQLQECTALVTRLSSDEVDVMRRNAAKSAERFGRDAFTEQVAAVFGADLQRAGEPAIA